MTEGGTVRRTEPVIVSLSKEDGRRRKLSHKLVKFAVVILYLESLKDLISNSVFY